MKWISFIKKKKMNCNCVSSWQHIIDEISRERVFPSSDIRLSNKTKIQDSGALNFL